MILRKRISGRRFDRLYKTFQLGLLATSVVMAQTSFAAVATGVMTVTATVAGTCIVGTSTLDFGTMTSAAIQAGNIDGQGSVEVNCTNGSAYTIALGLGDGTGATFISRTMASGVNDLNYSVYSETTRTTIWGDGTGGSSTVDGTGTGLTQSVSAYGRIFSGQNSPAANYSDIIAVTVSY
ncbi:MAG: spore coat U domain-containing protein [Pseudohongiella sp.]|nr:spore coat U domain-containing protein [Pseudohongiella sp.]